LIAFLNNNNKQAKKEIRETISFTIAQKIKIKYLGINLSKEVKDLYNKNCKTLKTLKKTLQEGKTSHVHGSAESIL
jgi:hypothetical protein